jgi:uncharacterized protein YlxW (UPF0749 family)
VDLGVQFFTAAKAQHESAAKWSLIVLIILLYFHLAIVGPFAKQTADKAEIEQELAQNQALESQLAPVVASAATFVNAVQAEVKDASTSLREDLVARFGMLDDKIVNLAMLGPEKAAGEEGAQLFKPELAVGFPQQQQQQQQLLPQLGLLVPILDPMPSALRRQVAEAAESQEYLEELERYIDESVIAPAFKRANESWATERRRNLASKAAQLDSQVESAAENAGTAADQFKALQAAVAALRDEAQRLRFAPPANSDWWRTVAGKGASIQIMMGAMTQSIGDISQQHGVLQAAKDRTSAIIAQNEQRAKQVAEKLADLEQQAKDLQAQLGEIGEPLKVISVRLSLLAPLLPLVISLAATALAIWRAEALRRMRFAADLVVEEAEDRVLRRWLQAAAGGSARVLAARETAIGLVMAGWVLAAWLAVRSLPAPLLSDAAIAGVAVAVLVSGRAYHWYQSAQALAFADRR